MGSYHPNPTHTLAPGLLIEIQNCNLIPFRMQLEFKPTPLQYVYLAFTLSKSEGLIELVHHYLICSIPIEQRVLLNPEGFRVSTP